MALGIERRQQVSVGRRSQYLLPETQRQRLSPLTECWELQALEGALITAPLLLPPSILPAQDDLEAPPLNAFQFVVLVFRQPRVPDRSCVFERGSNIPLV